MNLSAIVKLNPSIMSLSKMTQRNSVFQIELKSPNLGFLFIISLSGYIVSDLYLTCSLNESISNSVKKIRI